ncbi:glycine betaine ABC transporter substrate-binding protein [Salibacterium qingdaonense]|uniref:Glycine betaine/proline transport system substrate-binding protein n=1 Tax=Salibacterium qingdaonense TaxID=266892 RepID=A0A1I4Q996_9BACI|nr:glycine betaine ABC transporter substrate-binding protein [Salibacterium qingdaonense]SFM36366.1 glycine betaine/proline transport system substrate-binding protein [Salibacterium qingdaonense]
MKKIVLMIIFLLASIVLFACSQTDSEGTSGEGTEETTEANTEEKPELVLGLTNWTSTLPPTEIVTSILEEMGYSIEMEQANLAAIYAAMAEGDIDIYMDSWYPQQTQYLEEYSDSIEQLSPIYDNANAGMVVPEYMEDINDVADLVGNESMINNEVIAIEDGDPAMDELQELIDAYDLDVELVNSSEGAMISAAKASTDQNEPILLYGWRPHSMFNELGLKILTNKEHPEYFSGSSIHPLVYNNVNEKAPEAYEFLEDLTIPIPDMEEMIIKIDAGEDPEEVAQEWINDNRDRLDDMLKDNQ